MDVSRRRRLTVTQLAFALALVMSAITSRGMLAGLMLAFVALAGCDSTIGGARTTPAMSVSEVNAERQKGQAPGYWFGESVDGMTVRRYDRDLGILVEYGELFCDSGCFPEASVSTVPREELQDSYVGDQRHCWRRLERAWVHGCSSRWVNAMVFSGDDVISVSGVRSKRAEVQLVPTNRYSPPRFRRPDKFLCSEIKQFPYQWVINLPSALVPPGCIRD